MEINSVSHQINMLRHLYTRYLKQLENMEGVQLR